MDKRSRPSARDILVALAVAVLYFGCAKLGLSLAFRAEQVTAVWPPTGFALAAVLRLGNRSIPGILLGAFAANATADEPLWVAAGIAIGNTLEAVAGAALLRRLEFDTRLVRVRDVNVLLAAVVLVPIVSATIGVTSLGAGGVQPWSSVPGLWWLWWLGDALGALIVTPPLLLWTEHRLRVPEDLSRGWRPEADRSFFPVVLEAAMLLAGVAAASTIVFVRLTQIHTVEYVVFPFLIWAALRLGPIGAATAAITINAIAVAGTHAGRGPFAGTGPEQGLVHLQIFMAIAAVTGLLLGAAAAQKNAVERQLRDADRRKDEFLAMLGHELRNPLAPIVHAVDLLGRGDADLASRAAQIIRRQSLHMTRLVDDLLDVARITRGTINLERRTVPLADIVSAAVETWRHLIAERKQQLSVELPPHPIWIDVDPARFTQVVANLVHNAAKFTPDGGTISIVAATHNGWLDLRVRDSGPGMTSELLGRAFDLFVQGPPPLDRPHGGLGLGLTLVRRLVEFHGGSVEAWSEGVDRGTEVCVRIPLAEPPSEVPVVIESPPARAGARRVLVVEDNADAREMLFQLLKRAGHAVKTAADGPSALAEAERFSPEVILLDIGLPGMDGYEVARKLRSLRQSSAALIVAVTGYGQDADRVRSRDAGFDRHLMKPVDRGTLLNVLAEAPHAQRTRAGE